MRVAVITPYYQESKEVLMRCLNSVVKQNYFGVHHFVVADGYENRQDLITRPGLSHMVLPSCNDFGDTPRGAAAAVASAQGFDAIAFLDADCWYEPDHIRTMVGVMEESGRDIITCPRNLYDEAGRHLGVDVESDGYLFNDTNCYLIGKECFNVLSLWMFKTKDQAQVGDRILFNSIKEFQVKMARSTKATINYTTKLEMHKGQHGERSADAKEFDWRLM